MLLMSGNIFSQTVSTNKHIYLAGEAISVSFTGATNLKYRIGLFTATSTLGSASPSLCWQSVEGALIKSSLDNSGSVVFQNGLDTEGCYKVRLLSNDGYTVMTEANFTISNAVTLASNATNSTFITPGGKVNSTDQSSNSPTSRIWSFPGGTPSSSIEMNPIVAYASPGAYDVTLNATGESSTLHLNKPGFIKVSDQTVSVNLKVMQFNIWQEGTSVKNGITYIRDVINSVNPDLVCFSEVKNYSGDWTTKIVNELTTLGKKYYRGYVNGSDVSIISKYPITSSGPVIGGATVPYVLDVNGTSIVVCPSHLDYTYYATYLPRGYACGGSDKYVGWNALSPFTPETNVSEIEAQNLASNRDEQIGAFINYMQNETRPVLLIGDFNEPSCLDWTVRQANLYDHNGVVYEWPSTLLLKKNGFVDAYRQVYPDEVLNPGITWPAIATGAASTSWAPLSDERDRIDYIFYKGAGVTATAASIVGPPGSYVRNVATTTGNENDIFEASTMPWPSDHKAVTATINVSLTLSSINLINYHKVDVRVFPNPTTGRITLVPSENTKAQISISNISGADVLSRSSDLLANQTSLFDISGVPTGIYLLKVTSQNQSQVIRLIKQ